MLHTIDNDREFLVSASHQLVLLMAQPSIRMAGLIAYSMWFARLARSVAGCVGGAVWVCVSGV